MPYIIETTEPQHIDEPRVTRVAVATLNEARDAAADIIYRQHDGVTSHFDAFDTATYLPEQGGTIPLPSGATIDVRKETANA